MGYSHEAHTFDAGVLLPKGEALGCPAIAEPSANLRLYLLGPVRIGLLSEGLPVIALGRKTRALLAVLGMAQGRVVSRQRICELLWERSDRQEAMSSLRTALSQIARAFEGRGSCPFDRVDSGIRLDLNRCSVDLAPLLAPKGLWTENDHGRAFADACMSGLMEDLDGLTEALDEWLVVQRATFSEAVRGMKWTQLVRMVRQNADPTDQLRVARQILAFEPTHEGATRVVMRVYVEMGESTEALREYRRCADAIKAVFGISPSQETKRLYQSIKALREYKFSTKEGAVA